MFGFLRWESVRTREVVVRSSLSAHECLERVRATTTRRDSRLVFGRVKPRFRGRVYDDRVGLADLQDCSGTYGPLMCPRLQLRLTPPETIYASSGARFVGTLGRARRTAGTANIVWIGNSVFYTGLAGWVIVDGSGSLAAQLVGDAFVLSVSALTVFVSGNAARPDPTRFARQQDQLVAAFRDVVDGGLRRQRSGRLGLRPGAQPCGDRLDEFLELGRGSPSYGCIEDAATAQAVHQPGQAGLRQVMDPAGSDRDVGRLPLPGPGQSDGTCSSTATTRLLAAAQVAPCAVGGQDFTVPSR